MHVLGENAGPVAVFRTVDQLDGVVNVRHLDGGHQRTEHLGGEQGVAGRHVADDAGADKETVLVLFRQVHPAAIQNQLAALAVPEGDIHVIEHIVRGLAGNQRPHVDVGVKGVAHLDGLGGLNHALQHFLVNFRHGGHDGPGQAALPGGAVAGIEEVVDEDVHIAVFHDQKQVLGPAQQHGTLGPLGAARGHGFGRGRGAHQADARHARVLIPGTGNVAVAVHHVDHARGQPDFHEDLADELHEIG